MKAYWGSGEVEVVQLLETKENQFPFMPSPM
jgi:hypothetical protein